MGVGKDVGYKLLVFVLFEGKLVLLYMVRCYGIVMLGRTGEWTKRAKFGQHLLLTLNKIQNLHTSEEVTG